MQVAVPCPSLCSCRNGACGSVIVDVTEVGCIPQTYPMSKGFFFFFFYGSPSNVLHLKSLHNRWYCARKKIDSSWDMEIGVQNTLYPYRPTRDTSMMSRMLQNCIFNWIASLAAQFPPCSLKDKRSDHQNTSKDGGDKEWVADCCASVYLFNSEIWNMINGVKTPQFKLAPAITNCPRLIFTKFRWLFRDSEWCLK